MSGDHCRFYKEHNLTHPIILCDSPVATTLLRHIFGDNESASLWEVDQMVIWYGQNNLGLNIQTKTRMVVDFRKSKAPPAFIILCYSLVDPLPFALGHHGDQRKRHC